MLYGMTGNVELQLKPHRLGKVWYQSQMSVLRNAAHGEISGGS